MSMEPSESKNRLCSVSSRQVDNLTQEDSPESLLSMAAVERRSRVENSEFVPFFAAPSTTDKRCPSVPTTRNFDSRISSLIVSVQYRVDSAERQNAALFSAASSAEARICPRKLSSPSGIRGKFFGSTKGNSTTRLFACTSNLLS